MLRKILAGAVVAMTALTAGAQAAEMKELNFGIISTESSQNLKTVWQPFLSDMEKKLGMKVNAYFAPDYAGIIEGMRFKKVDIAWYGNKSAMEAVDRANGEVFVQTVADTGEPGYWSVLIVPADSPIQSVDDLLTCDKSLNFGLGDPNSTSGYLVPTTFVFAAEGIDPKECFANVTNANHETNAMAVANGQVDAATNNTESLALIKQNNPDAYANIREIWRSPLIPSDPIVWRTDLADETKETIREFFLTFGTEESNGDVQAEKEVLGGLAWAPFRASSNDQLLPIRIMELTKEIGQLQADTRLEAEEKAARLEELEAQKAEYEAQLVAVSQS